MGIKLIAIDLDGTLLTSSQKITWENERAIKEVSQSGVKVVLATGRPLSGVMPYDEQLGLAGSTEYNIVFNGAVVQNLTGEILLNQQMNYDDFRTILRLKRLSHVMVHFETPECFWTCDRDLPQTMMRNAVATNNILKVRLKEEIPPNFTFNKVSFTSMNDFDQVDKFWQALPDWAFAKYDIVRSFADIVEMNAQEASKGNALIYLADRLKIKPEEVMIFGDQGNDISMFNNPSFQKIAMGNAIDLIKQKADYVTDDNDHNGIAKALKKFIL